MARVCGVGRRVGDPRVFGRKDWGTTRRDFDCVGIGVGRVATRVDEERLEVRRVDEEGKEG